MANEKSCKNCKYYLAHYIKKSSFLLEIGGHCINRKLNAKKFKNKFQLYENCEKWESKVSENPERREAIEAVLRGMKERLEDIAFILKDDT